MTPAQHRTAVRDLVLKQRGLDLSHAALKALVLG